MIFAVACLARLFFLFFAARSPLYHDEKIYWNLANKIHEGTYSEVFFLPLWPYVLSICLEIYNHPISGRIVVCFIGAICSVLVYLLAKKNFNEKVALVAGLIHALYPEHIFYSHYLYAEILLELFIIGATLLALSSSLFVSVDSRLYFASIVLGIGLLCKHFVLITFAALFTTFSLWNPISAGKIIKAVLIFLIPSAIFTIYLYIIGNDPLALLNAPLKTMFEWSYSGGRANFDNYKRGEILSTYLMWLKDLDFSYFLKNIQKNLYNLWEPNSHASWYFNIDYYPIRNKQFFINMISLSHVGLILLGISGMFLSEAKPFRTYAISSILYLSLISLMCLMDGRYRVPFLFLFCIFTAVAITQPIWRNAAKLPKRFLVLLLLIVGFIHIFVTRISNIGTNPP